MAAASVFAALVSLSLVSGSVNLRQDAAAPAREEARITSPADLGDTILVTGHPPIVEKIVHPVAMEAPPPPDSDGTYNVDLISAAEPGPLAGFCTKAIYHVTVQGQAAQSESAPPPAALRPKTLETALVYRLATPGATGAATCEAPVAHFFSASENTKRTFRLVEQLAEVQRLAGGHKPLPFFVSIDDQEGRSFEQSALGNPELGSSIPQALKQIHDARSALAALPVDQIGWVGAGLGVGSLFKSSDFTNNRGRPLKVAEFYIEDNWVVGMALAGDKVVRVRIVRQFPPPF